MHADPEIKVDHLPWAGVAQGTGASVTSAGCAFEWREERVECEFGDVGD